VTDYLLSLAKHCQLSYTPQKIMFSEPNSIKDSEKTVITNT